MPPKETIRLTALSHSGGCGCKIAPGTLDCLLEGIAVGADAKKLLAGNSTRDDAAVFAFDDSRALVATTDFFTPIVDEPWDFGRIAAANAISDIYAMGAKPLFALNIAGMPADKLPPAVITAIFEGGRDICGEAGILIVGGHSINSPEPIYGLAVTGEVSPVRVKYNSGALPGDALILGKPLGVGVIAAAARRGLASPEAYQQMLTWATLLNRVGETLGTLDGVHAMTDVSGYGLLGHLIEMCEASGAGAELRWEQIPVIAPVHDLLGQGVASPAAGRNRAGYDRHVDFGRVAADIAANLLYDPQTNGGLLVSCAAGDADRVLDHFHRDGCTEACVIGRIQSSAGIRLR